jgi:DedD protein
MENRLKERLTGAAILVALIVLVVPELFHGQRDAAPGDAHGAGEAPVQRSYVIDLKDSAAPAAAASASSADGAAPAAPAAPAMPAAVVNTPVAPVPVSSAPGWSVQLGLFAQRENAQRLLQAAQSKGFAVSIASGDGNGLYRVRVAGLADRAAAENVRARLRAQGFPAAIVGP